MKSDLTDVEVYIHHETDAAVLVSSTDDRNAEKVWLPLSQIEINHRGRRHAEITLPEWLAIEKGLV